jgi:hypothetical protein
LWLNPHYFPENPWYINTCHSYPIRIPMIFHIHIHIIHMYIYNIYLSIYLSIYIYTYIYTYPTISSFYIPPISGKSLEMLFWGASHCPSRVPLEVGKLLPQLHCTAQLRAFRFQQAKLPGRSHLDTNKYGETLFFYCTWNVYHVCMYTYIILCIYILHARKYITCMYTYIVVGWVGEFDARPLRSACQCDSGEKRSLKNMYF